MPPFITQLLSLFGFFLRVLGFLLFGFALGKFVLEQFKTAGWQVQAVLVLAFFGLAAAYASHATPGASGAFALGGGVAFLMASMPKKKAEETDKEK